jgi:hypothetical protein
MPLPSHLVKKTTYGAAKRYAKEVFDHDLVLTPEDVDHFVTTDQGKRSTNVNFDLFQTSSRVGDFVRYGDHGRWALLGAEILVGCNCDLLRYKERVVRDPATGEKERRPLTWGEIQADVDWMEGTSLDEDEQQVLDAWFALTPYRVWVLVEDVIEWATDSLRENAFQMALGNGGGTDVFEAVKNRFEHVVSEWEKAWLKAGS